MNISRISFFIMVCFGLSSCSASINQYEPACVQEFSNAWDLYIELEEKSGGILDLELAERELTQVFSSPDQYKKTFQEICHFNPNSSLKKQNDRSQEIVKDLKENKYIIFGTRGQRGSFSKRHTGEVRWHPEGQPRFGSLVGITFQIDKDEGTVGNQATQMITDVCKTPLIIMANLKISIPEDCQAIQTFRLNNQPTSP